MTGRERVRRAIHFDSPDRVPFWGKDSEDFTPEVNLAPSFTFSPRPDEELRPRVKLHYDILTENECGSISGSFSYKPGGETVAPAFEDWSQAADYRWPDTDDPRRVEHARAVFAADDRYRLVVCPGVATGLTMAVYGLRTMEGFFEDVALHPDELIAWQESGLERDLRNLRNWAALGADGCLVCDDLGTQDRLLLNPKTWRRVFKPFVTEWLAEAHRLGMEMILHSCGYIWELIPDLIEAGWDVLQLDQPRALGIEKLGAEFGGQVCFYCPVDIQKTMPTGDREAIESEARLLIHELGRFNGGFMGKDYGQWATIQIPDEWTDWAREAFYRYGKYPLD